jgi:hypothetical protein
LNTSGHRFFFFFFTKAKSRSRKPAEKTEVINGLCPHLLFRGVSEHKSQVSHVPEMEEDRTLELIRFRLPSTHGRIEAQRWEVTWPTPNSKVEAGLAPEG